MSLVSSKQSNSMKFRTAYLVLVGYVILFEKMLTEANAVDGDILIQVLSELEDLKAKVNTCEDKLMKMDIVNEKNDDKLQTSLYEQRLNSMEERLLAAEQKLQTNEDLYKEKLAQSEDKLRAVGNKLKALEELNLRLANVEEIIVALNYKRKESDLTVNADNSVRENMGNKPSGEKLPEADMSNVTDQENTVDKGKSFMPETDNYYSETERKPKHAITDTKGSDPRENKTVYIKHEKRFLNEAVSHRVAFTAHLSVQPTELGRQHTIPFDQVLLNEGQAYDTVAHMFICPVNGVYIFQSALMCDYNQRMETEMVKDGTVLGRLYAKGSNGYDQGFNSATIQCNQGEHVWVRVRDHYGKTMLHGLFSTFSGHILWET